jgi:uncharacterized membrane protein YbhN (UPF0104 family)
MEAAPPVLAEPDASVKAPPAPPRADRRAEGWARKLAPWAVAAAILAYLFWEIPFAEAWDAASAARLELFLPGVLAVVTFWFFLESAALAYLFSRFNAPLSWAEARSLRGVTYLLTPINWHAATAGIILHLRRSKEVGAIESASSMLFYGLIDGMILAGLALLGVSLLPASPEVASLRNIAAGIEGFQVALLALFMAPAPAWRWLQRLRGLAIFRTHGLATLRDVGCLLLLRGLYFSVFVGLFWLGNRAFGVDLPLEIATATMPAILLAAAIPITPAGLGTQQAAMLFFFSPYGDEAAILAFGLSFPIAVTLSRCLLGLRYLRGLERLRHA